MRTGQTAKAKTAEMYDRMEDIRNRLKMSVSDFSLALGYVTGGGYPSSTKGNIANLMQLLAAEGVEMRYSGKSAQRPTSYTLLAMHPDGRIDSMPIGGSPETITLRGREYILVPKKP
jgi:hypothetical protein